MFEINEKKFAAALKMAGMTQSDFAKRFDVSPAMITYVKKGQRRNPDIELSIRLFTDATFARIGREEGFGSYPGN